MIVEYKVLEKEDNIILKSILKNKMKISINIIKKIEPYVKLYRDDAEILNVKVTNRVKYKDRIAVDISKFEQDTTLPDEYFVNKYNCPKKNINILYEDEYIVAVEKEADLNIHPTCLEITETLANFVAPYLYKQGVYKIHIVNRLDKDASGVCIFAKNAYIQELFNRDLDYSKEYVAIVHGKLEKPNDILSAKIARKPGSIIEREVSDAGKEAITEYTVLKYNEKKDYTTLLVKLHTGRTHQIRVHMKYIGHPLLGDELYGGKQDLISRQALHCYRLSFAHPITNRNIKIVCDLPEDMKKLNI